MMPHINTCLPIVFFVIYILSNQVLCDIVNTDDLAKDIRFLKTLNNAHEDLTSLQNTVSSLDSDLEDYQKRTCKFGLNSQHCALANLDSFMGSRDWLTSGYSPGKRSGNQLHPDDASKYERIVEDIGQKRQNLALLKNLLDGAKEDINTKRKRTCRVNLGAGGCATELASAIADQYYYLQGPNSPGKRKRRSIVKRKSPLKLVVNTDLQS